MTYDLKPASSEDMDFIINLRNLTLKPYIEQIWGWNEAYQTEDFKQNFVPKRNKIIFIDNEPVGVLELFENATDVHILEVEIHPEFQGKGIGTKIIQEVIDRCKDENKKIGVGCFKINSGALNLYYKLGFKQVDETETHYLLMHEQKTIKQDKGH